MPPLKTLATAWKYDRGGEQPGVKGRTSFESRRAERTKGRRNEGMKEGKYNGRLDRGRGALVGGASSMLAARPANQRPARPDGRRKTRRKEEEIMLMDPGRRLVLSRNATGHAQCAAWAEGRSLPWRSLDARSPGCQVSARDLHPGAGWSITTAAARSAPSFLFFSLFVCRENNI